MNSVKKVPCPQCHADTRCHSIRRDGDFASHIKFGRYRICRACFCKIATVVKEGIEQVDFIIDQGGAVLVEAEVDDQTPVEANEIEPEPPEVSDTWKDLHQMRRALVISVYHQLQWFGRGGATGNEDLTALAGQIRAAKKGGFPNRPPQPTFLIRA